jgi:hypothetical protein
LPGDFNRHLRASKARSTLSRLQSTERRSDRGVRKFSVFCAKRLPVLLRRWGSTGIPLPMIPNRDRKVRRQDASKSHNCRGFVAIAGAFYQCFGANTRAAFPILDTECRTTPCLHEQVTERCPRGTHAWRIHNFRHANPEWELCYPKARTATDLYKSPIERAGTPSLARGWSCGPRG